LENRDDIKPKAVDPNATLLLIGGDSNKPISGHYLIINDSTQPHKRYEILVDGTIEIGREPNQPGIAIDYDKKISRRHCSVTLRGNSLWLADLGSSNKTYVNNEMVTSERILKDGDELSCGNTRFFVRIERR
jgi:pSer/pThr/pTyr-binding forkhead associated (FHA) protein